MNLFSKKVSFLEEQRGNNETLLKEHLAKAFLSQRKVHRAYLVKTNGKLRDDFNVTLAIASEPDTFEEIMKVSSAVFSDMFSIHEALNIMLLDKNTENKLRKKCCPFYSVVRVDNADFHLSLGDGGDDEDGAKISCYKKRRLDGGHPDGYLLCEINPKINGQKYGLGGKNISNIILASRHKGVSIFNDSLDGMHVHIAFLKAAPAIAQFDVSKEQLKSIGWGILHEKGEKVCLTR